MIGTIVNFLAILLGGIIGVSIKEGLKENYKEIIMDSLALIVIVIGLTSALKSESILTMIFSLIIGVIIGESLKIDKKLNKIGEFLERKFGRSDSNFSKGFVTTSLIFCVGAMAIVGSLESGLTGNHNTLYAKSVIDGITSIVFASTLGIGVAFSSFAVFLYQGTITILASFLTDFLIDSVVLEMSAVGGILISAIGINILGLKEIKVSNMLPAIFLPLVFYIVKLIYLSI
ncbi:DUF554 domain-containing protein [Senegalia massiliensis]|uniref:DUF554 domain-containing protein n=1 Tax=Senegalia massiliensis TaxID=1720316 RepID=A0A845R0Q5_9CLOT|nr:DUF554 domain-containing protein [Senegalia massiliensis]NBI07306.1 DUF554 domain-containing protein [Senegalia massiliensis]